MYDINIYIIAFILLHTLTFFGKNVLICVSIKSNKNNRTNKNKRYKNSFFEHNG